jgi:hypothetical protein
MNVTWDLRSKIGVWQMPLFKFLHLEIWRWNLRLDKMKRLKYRIPNFRPKMPKNAYSDNANARLWILWESGITRDKFYYWGNMDVHKGNTQVTRLGEKNIERERTRIQLHWRSNIVSLGERLHIICLSRQWDQNYLFIKVTRKDGTLSAYHNNETKVTCLSRYYEKMTHSLFIKMKIWHIISLSR